MKATTKESKKTNRKWSAILNPNNRLITKKEVEAILRKGDIRLELGDISVWQEAFVHKSYIYHKQNISPKENKTLLPLQKKSNERLEWLGDALLQAVVTHYLYERYPNQNEGFLTKLRSELVRTRSLSNLATKLGFSKYLIVSHHVEVIGHGRMSARILENTFEAFVGAMYLDFSKKKNPAFGYEVVRRFVSAIVEKYADIVNMIVNNDNFKDQLMWHFQTHFNGAYPIYKKEKQENDYFFVSVAEPNSDKIVGRGRARSKKMAEQEAAKQALQHYLKQS